MNQNIKKFADNCWVLSEIGVECFDYAKFAEMIIKETINQAYKSWLNDNSVLPTIHREEILDHFGIKHEK